MSDISDFNQKQYKDHFLQYLESNREGTIGGGTPQERIELLKRFLPDGRTIFEIGSGGGNDALVLKEAGYRVTASDYVEEFITILQEKGLHAIQFDAKHDDLSESIDSVYANAVFVHFSPEDFTNFLNRVKDKLTHEKIVFISVIKGEGHERSARSRGFERDFYYYSPSVLRELTKNAGYEMLYLNEVDEKWIQMIIRASQ